MASLRPSARTRQPVGVGAGDLPRSYAPPDFPALDVSGVRWVSYGGAPIAESLVHAIKEAFPNSARRQRLRLTEPPR